MQAKPRLAVFCSGYGSNFQAIIDAVRKKNLKAEIAVMVCDNPKAYALKRAAKAGIPSVLLSPKLFPSRHLYERVIAGILRSQKIDVVILAGYMRILTPYFIREYEGRILNVHPSYLPAFKGAHAIRDAFEAKVKETGVTIHVVTNELDSGPILLQEKVKISRRDTLQSLEKKIHAVEFRLYSRAIQKFISSTKIASRLRRSQ